MNKNVLVFSLGALAAFGAAGWLRSGRPVDVTSQQFQAPQHVLARPQTSPLVTSEAVVENIPVWQEPVWQEEVAPARARRASLPVVRRASPTSDEQAKPRPSETAEPRLKQREPRPAEDASEDAREPQLRQQETPQDRTEAQSDASIYRNDPVVRERSKKASIAIVAGSAAAGAAIGAATGGGKGAAIGAIAGGAGGYVYDRMTHKKRDTSQAPVNSGYGNTAGYRGSDSAYGAEDTKMDTLKRVGVGAAGGAALGGLAGGGKGAAIGAIAGGAGGYIYDRVKRR